MKLKINKLQAGGYLTYQPLPMVPEVQPQTAVQPEEEEKKEEGYLDKEVINKLLGSGITTDVMEYSDKMEQAYKQYAGMSEFQKASYQGRQVRSMLKGNMGELNALVRSKNMFDKSMETAKSNGALEEFAVTDGGMVVKDTAGKVTVVSFAQYAADKNNDQPKYHALTNSQLAEEREFNKALINNTTVFSVLNYGKGMVKIKEEIFNSVKNLGNNKTSIQNGQFQLDKDDVDELARASKEGMFKIKSGQSVETNSPQLEKAKQAMWVNLSENSKNVLRARAASEVADPKDIEKMAMTMAVSLLDPQESTSVSKTYDETVRNGKGGAGGSGSDKMKDWGPLGLARSGGGDVISLSQIGPEGVKIEGFASAIDPSVYTNDKNERVTLRNAGKLNGISYLSKAFTANGDKVNPDLTTITGDAYVSELPYTVDENGNHKIDEEGSKKWAEFEQAFKSLPSHMQTPLKESELKQEFGVSGMRTAAFVVAEAASYEESYWGGRDERYYEKLEGSELSFLANLIDPGEQHVRYSPFENSAHKHLVFIPAKSLATWNSADGNHTKVPEAVYDVRGGYNQGRNGMNTARGNSMTNGNAPASNLTADWFNTK